jgi:hypothetical protein
VNNKPVGADCIRDFGGQFVRGCDPLLQELPVLRNLIMRTFPVLLLLISWSAVASDVDSRPDFVGRQVCASCHAAQEKLWQDSHHDLAMQAATAATVLGDFNNREFTHAGTTSRFFRKDARFMVRTDGPDGKLTDYEIKYTFGVTPLQQYLIAFPGGRLQALSIAWDARIRMNRLPMMMSCTGPG